MLLNKAVEFFVNKSVGTKSNFYGHCEMIILNTWFFKHFEAIPHAHYT